jgi:hypothetical protein
MLRATRLATPAAIVALLAAPAAALAATGPAVTVRVEGVKRTLLSPSVVHTKTGWITRFGAPKGDCPASSAQGALDVATRHRWGGRWDASLLNYEILSILGESHNFNRELKYFWEVFVNNVAAPTGACELKLHRGEQILFAAVPQQGNTYTTALQAPARVTLGARFSVKVVWFNARGRARPLQGARVTGNGVSATTNAQGIAMLTATHAGALVLHARHSWSPTAYVRAAPVTVQVS